MSRENYILFMSLRPIDFLSTIAPSSWPRMKKRFFISITNLMIILSLMQRLAPIFKVCISLVINSLRALQVTVRSLINSYLVLGKSTDKLLRVANSIGNECLTVFPTFANTIWWKGRSIDEWLNNRKKWRYIISNEFLKDYYLNKFMKNQRRIYVILRKRLN